MSKITRGVNTIEVGAIASDGGPGTALAVLGLTLAGTAKMSQSDATTQDILVEESDVPLDSIITPGSIAFNWTIANPDTATLVTLFGGTATGTSPNKTWNMPAAVITQELTVKVTPKKGMTVVFPRASVTAKMNGDFSKTAVFGIDVTITPLLPTKAGVGPVQFIE